LGYTSEERDHLSRPLCGAMTKRGVKCRAFAGQGVEGNPGVGACKYHGGSTSSHRTHAVKVEAKRRLALLGEPIDVSAPQALMSLLRGTAGLVAWLDAERPTWDLGKHEGQVWLRMFSDERDRLTRVGEACIRAGVAEHIVNAEKHEVQQIAKAMQDACREVGFTDKQRQALGAALRKRLTDGAADPADDAHLQRLKDEIKAADEQRIEQAAQKYSGLTFPPEEVLTPGGEERPGQRILRRSQP